MAHANAAKAAVKQLSSPAQIFRILLQVDLGEIII
jgi:hypothetical protein